MSAALETGSCYTAAYDSLRGHLPGQHLNWLKQLREQALESFSKQGFPSLRDEEWKYTNVSALEKKCFAPVFDSEATAPDHALYESLVLKDCWRVVLNDGHYCASLSQLEGLPQDVFIGSISDALEQIPEQVEAYFGKALADQDHGFVHFNNAWFVDGLFVYVPAKVVLPKPVQVLHLVSHADALVTTRHIIAVAEQAEVKVIECYSGNPAHAYLTAAVTEVFVAANAELSLYKLQTEAEKAYHFGGVYVQQAADARFKHYNFTLGGLLTRNELATDLQKAAECELNGLYVGVKRQHVDNHIRINHVKPHANSRIIYKGVLDQRARGVFQGRVVVAEDAQKTDSVMNNRNLLLSEHAEADSKPQLEIYADDVKCAHGVTTGQLDEKSVFYLQSRCIDEASARNMLTFAFANDMVEKLDHNDFKQCVLAQLLAHFPQTGIVKAWL